MAGETAVANATSGVANAGGFLGWLGGPWGTALSLAMPTILGMLGGRGEDLVSMRRRAQAMLDPNAIENERGVQLANLINSPATAAMRDQMVAGGQAATDGLNARLAQTGLGRSGVGLAMEGAIRAAPDVQMGRMLGGFANDAMERALQIQQARANAIMQGGAVNSMARDMFGATVAAAMPILLNAKFGKKTDTNTTTNTNTNKPVGAGTTTAQATGSKFAYPNYMQQYSQPVFSNRAQHFGELNSRYGRFQNNGANKFNMPMFPSKFDSGMNGFFGPGFKQPLWKSFYNIPEYDNNRGWDASGGFNVLYGGR